MVYSTLIARDATVRYTTIHTNIVLDERAPFSRLYWNTDD